MVTTATATKQSENGVNKETVEDKVLKNRLAQKKFREKKQQKYKELLERCNYLEKMNKELKENEAIIRKQLEQLTRKNGGDIFMEKGSLPSIDEDTHSSSDISSKESENLAQLIKKNEQSRSTSNNTTEMNFSFPWGASTNMDSATTNNKSTGNSFVVDDLIIENHKQSIPQLHEHDHEYDFKNGLDENNFCSSLGNACPYTPSNTLNRQLDIIGKTSLQGVGSQQDLNGKSELNNIESVFGLPNFSFSPTGLDTLSSSDKRTNSVDFLGNSNLALTNSVDTPSTSNFNTTQPKGEINLFEDATPMNFNFNFLLNNSIDEKPTPIPKNISTVLIPETDSLLLGNNSNEETQDNNDKIVGVHQSDDEEEEDDEHMVVPNDGKLFTCSEIWDRITSNPKLSDLDLDNLCMELKTKAKCSEKGVLIKEEDLNRALSLHQATK
ncbi:hypothetical protein ACO0SA_003944 [Hanseniaspora valbyensis]